MQREETPGRTAQRSARRTAAGKRYRAVSRAVAVLMCCAALFVSGFILGLYRQGLFGSAAVTAPNEQAVTGPTVTVTSPGPAQTTSGPTQAAPEPTAPPPTAEELLAGLKWPVAGRIVRDPAWLYSEPLKEWFYLPGVDIAVEPGSPVKAAIRGAVESIRSDAVLGTVLILRHEGGLETTYGRLASTTKAPGDNVVQGEVIGTSGPDNVYFKIARDGEPLNPQDYLAKAK